MRSLDKFLDWQAVFPADRRVDIKITPHRVPGTELYEQQLKIWVTDDRIHHSGHFVDKVEDIDCVGAARIYDMAEIERLQEKYKGTEG